MARETQTDPVSFDEKYLEAKRAEIEAYRKLPAPGEQATEEEKAAYAAIPSYIQEATDALNRLEATLRERRIEESRRRQQEVQWEVVRLRLRKTVTAQADHRRRNTVALVSRMLPSDRSLTSSLTEADLSQQRRYLSDAIAAFQGALKYLPAEEALGESRVLLEYFSLLPIPGPSSAAQDHRTHLQLSESARELKGMASSFERQVAMRAMMEHALSPLAQKASGPDN
jgi:hypothetical protein